jgi:ribosomal protein S18 acetylase RimI-like enzyme
MPAYREKGIGTYLLSNIFDIFNIYLNRYIHAIVTYPKPLPLSGETITEKEEAKMLLKMKRHLKRAGYTEIGKSNFYMQNFATKNDYEREREIEYGKT